MELTIETVLQKITEYDVFMHYMPDRFWKINQVTNSPFHADEHPSFMIGNRNGYLYFVDFAKGTRGGCFDFVKELYHLSSLDEVLRLIDRDFGLGIVSNTNVGEYKKIKAQYKQPEETLGKRYSVIQVVTRKFTNEELDYWKKYSTTEEDLRKEHIYSIKELYVNRKKYLLDNEIRFGYLYNNSYWKIYFPNREKRRKWISNVPLTMLDGKESLKDCDIVFITKSKKDKIILSKIHPHVIATQNESLACFSTENVDFIKSNSKRQILMYDSDDPGVQASQQITKLLGFEYCNPPRKYLPDVKDFSDMAMLYSLDEVRKFIKNKLLL